MLGFVDESVYQDERVFASKSDKRRAHRAALALCPTIIMSRLRPQKKIVYCFIWSKSDAFCGEAVLDG